MMSARHPWASATVEPSAAWASPSSGGCRRRMHSVRHASGDIWCAARTRTTRVPSTAARTGPRATTPETLRNIGGNRGDPPALRLGAERSDAAGNIVGAPGDTRIDAIEGVPLRLAQPERHGLAQAAARTAPAGGSPGYNRARATAWLVSVWRMVMVSIASSGVLTDPREHAPWQRRPGRVDSGLLVRCRVQPAVSAKARLDAPRRRQGPPRFEAAHALAESGAGGPAPNRLHRVGEEVARSGMMRARLARTCGGRVPIA